MYKISKDNVFTNFQRRVYLQKYIYFSFKKCVYLSCNHYMLISFLFFLKNDWFFFKKKFIFPCLCIFRCGQDLHNADRVSMEFFEKLRLRSWLHQAGLKINLSKKWGKCMNARMCAIFFIFDILDFFCLILTFRKRCMSVLRTYEIYMKSYDDLWECMYGIHIFHLC